jgi:hypothetical protein
LRKALLDISKMRVAKPCSAGWENMAGDDRARFCGKCDRNVYNIVGMDSTRIAELVQKTEGRLCVRMYSRADGTVLTNDCPVGLRAYRKRAAVFAGAAFSTLLGLFSASYAQKSKDAESGALKIERTKIESNDAVITGNVMDLNGAVIPGAEIELFPKSGRSKFVRSNEEGSFRMEGIEAGKDYILKVEAKYFVIQKITNLSIEKNERINFEVFLEVGDKNLVVGLFLDSNDVIIETEPAMPFKTITRRKPLELPKKNESKSDNLSICPAE